MRSGLDLGGAIPIFVPKKEVTTILKNQAVIYYRKRNRAKDNGLTPHVEVSDQQALPSTGTHFLNGRDQAVLIKKHKAQPNQRISAESAPSPPLLVGSGSLALVGIAAKR
jgi:hypothetical protein